MNIKSSQKLVEEAEKKIETISAEKAKELAEKKEITLIDVRDIRELLERRNNREFNSYTQRNVRILAGSRKLIF